MTKSASTGPQVATAPPYSIRALGAQASFMSHFSLGEEVLMGCWMNDTRTGNPAGAHDLPRTPLLQTHLLTADRNFVAHVLSL